MTVYHLDGKRLVLHDLGFAGAEAIEDRLEARIPPERIKAGICFEADHSGTVPCLQHLLQYGHRVFMLTAPDERAGTEYGGSARTAR